MNAPKILRHAPRRTPLVVGLVVVLILVTSASWRDAGQARAVEGGNVTVFAAASLTSAFQAVAGAFEKSHAGVKIQLSFAGSPTLVQQIQEGAPADVFAAADEANMHKLVESGAVAGAPAVFARNVLQIVVAPHNPKHIMGLADLAKPGLVIALCGPSVPCGHYATEAFTKAGAVVPAASQEPDVKAVMTKVVLGEADAGVVYATDIRAAGDKVEGVSIPESSNVVARYPIVALKSASNAAGGAEFVAFVLSPEGQRIIATFGFLAR
jgi:molybdate transport system substrate-binding protein